MNVTVDAYDAAPSMTAALRGASTGRAETPQRPRTISLGFEVALLILVDALVASLAAFVGLDARLHQSTTEVAGIAYGTIALGFPSVWVLAMAIGGAYDHRFLANGNVEFRRALNAAVWLGAGAAITSYLLDLDLSRGFIGLTIPFAILLTLLCRVIVRKGLHERLSQGAAIHRVVVVGPQSSADRLIKHLDRSSLAGYAVVGLTTPGYLGNADDPATLERHMQAFLGNIVDTARRLGADTIAVTGEAATSQTRLQRLSWHLEGTGIQLMVAPNVADVAGPRILVRPIAGLPLLHIEEPEFRGAKRVVKEAMDRVGAAVLLLTLSPILATIAAAALITQGRPLLYRQTRVGREGRTFHIHKFRTMRNGADLQQHLLHINQTGGGLAKSAQDPRITRLGGLLRKYSLDELPQLWDVLTGSMSLVGPRPQQPFEVERYEDDARRRLLVKPGITGLWQVSGRSDLSWEEWVRLDLHYVENWSVGLDLHLLWKTVFAVLRPEGAY